MPVIVKGLRWAFDMVETASAYAENGHNGAIFEKKVPNSSSATTKREKECW